MQDDVVPLDRADVAQQRELDAVALRIAVRMTRDMSLACQ